MGVFGTHPILYLGDLYLEGFEFRLHLFLLQQTEDRILMTVDLCLRCMEHYLMQWVVALHGLHLLRRLRGQLRHDSVRSS